MIAIDPPVRFLILSLAFKGSSTRALRAAKILGDMQMAGRWTGIWRSPLASSWSSNASPTLTATRRRRGRSARRRSGRDHRSRVADAADGAVDRPTPARPARPCPDRPSARGGDAANRAQESSAATHRSYGRMHERPRRQLVIAGHKQYRCIMQENDNIMGYNQMDWFTGTGYAGAISTHDTSELKWEG